MTRIQQPTPEARAARTRVVLNATGLLASVLGALSAISLAHYSVEAFADEYPRWMWLGLTGAALIQLAASAFLFVRRSLLATVAFLVIAIPLAILEQQTSIAVAFARNFLSVGAAIVGLGLLVALVATRSAED